MAARYGWTLPQIRAMRCNDHARMLGAATENKKEEGRAALMAPAFSFWLEYGGQKGMPFGRFCEKIGLIEPRNDSSAIRKIQASEAIARAEEIRNADKRQAKQ